VVIVRFCEVIVRLSGYIWVAPVQAVSPGPFAFLRHHYHEGALETADW